MPIYDYACVSCGDVVEVVHGVHHPGPTACPQCGGLLRKRVSYPAIHVRGRGWAKKDARRAAATRAGKTDKGGGRGVDGGAGEGGATAGPKSDQAGDGGPKSSGRTVASSSGGTL